MYENYKLVRDKIPEIVKDDTLVFDRVLDYQAYNKLLIKKLHEEVSELVEALEGTDLNDIEGELADVYEVLFTLGDIRRCRDLVEVAQEKFSKRGGFYQGYILKLDNG